MKKTLVLLLFLLFVFPGCIMANTFSNVELGKLEAGNLKLVCDEAVINTYKAYDTNYIAVSDLKYLGCQIAVADGSIFISNPTYGSLVPDNLPSLASQPFSIYGGKVIVDHFETQCLSSNGRTLIPLAALSYIGTLSITDDLCYFYPTGSVPVAVSSDSITNLDSAPLTVSVLDIYWKNQPITKTSTYVLDPMAHINRPAPVTDKDAIYVASIVQSATGENYSYSTTNYFGQLNTSMLKKYTELTTPKVVPVPKNAGNYGDPIDAAGVAEAEAFVNGKNLSSPTPYLVWTNIAKQRTYIFKGSKNNWTLVKHFICSTGKDRTPTPKGTFALTRKVPSFGQNKGYCCKYAFGFIGTSYLYHSIIYDKTGSYLLENKGVLGKKASDGCIRFSAEHAYWFYNNLISGTTVYIN